jgi:hypothetical protein
MLRLPSALFRQDGLSISRMPGSTLAFPPSPLATSEQQHCRLATANHPNVVRTTAGPSPAAGAGEMTHLFTGQTMVPDARSLPQNANNHVNYHVHWSFSWSTLFRPVVACCGVYGTPVTHTLSLVHTCGSPVVSPLSHSCKRGVALPARAKVEMFQD